MKTPDPASEPPRRSHSASAEPGPRRSEECEEEELRYISLPRRRARGHGARNLAWGVALLVVAFLLLGFGLYLAGPGAAYTVGVSLATAATLYVVARARLLRQRNGNFLAAAIVCVLAVSCVLVQAGWLRLTGARKGDTATAEETPASPTTPAQPIALFDAFRPSTAELEDGEIAEVVRNATVQYDGRTWLLRPGDVFPVHSVERGQVKLGVLTDEITVPSSVVKVRMAPPSEPEPEPPPRRQAGNQQPPPRQSPGAEPQMDQKELDRLVDLSKREAQRRYPALGIEGSPENLSFVDTVNDIKVDSRRRGMFQNPDWPLRLAEQLAAWEGWTDANGNRKEPRKQSQPGGEPPASAPDAGLEPDLPPRGAAPAERGFQATPPPVRRGQAIDEP